MLLTPAQFSNFIDKAIQNYEDLAPFYTQFDALLHYTYSQKGTVPDYGSWINKMIKEQKVYNKGFGSASPG